MTTGDDWRRLNKDYRDNGVALALGSGVSLACQLPNWRDLLERIAIRCYGRRGQNASRNAQRNGIQFDRQCNSATCMRPLWSCEHENISIATTWWAKAGVHSVVAR